MSKIKNASISIYEALNNIENGKYVMPAFQRQYVWSMGQIEKLWDSILLDYPLATFLFWHLDSDNTPLDTLFCNFLKEASFSNKKNPDSKNYELSTIKDINITDTAVLDGQQRLTSLYLSLIGSTYIRQKFARKKLDSGIVAKLLIELNKNKQSIDDDEYNSKKYDVKFTEKIGKVSPTQFEIRKILNERFRNKETRNEAIEEAIVCVPPDSKNYAKGIMEKLCCKIYDEKLIQYTEISDMTQDDALEMFVRFNSGGKALSKSEITMSILEVYWPSAKTEFGEISKIYGFNTDFIIRTALLLYGNVIKSVIIKQIAEDLKNNWESFKQSLTNLDCLLEDIGIDKERFKESWNVLLPIIYCIYYNPNYINDKAAIKIYLVRAILFTYFQSGTTSKLQKLKSNIIKCNCRITLEMLDQITELKVTEGKIDDILNSEKESRVAKEALYFLSSNWLNKNFKYELDHLHPSSRFDKSKPDFMTVQDWDLAKSNRNRLANLHLLEGSSNGGKSDMSLLEYYNNKNDEQKAIFREQAFLPQNVSSLLQVRDFNVFYNERRKLLRNKLIELLTLDNTI